MSESDDIRVYFKEAMRENSAHLIQATIKATTEVLDKQLLEYTNGLIEIIDDKIASSSKLQHQELKIT